MEDHTGQLNDIVAKKTRDVIKINREFGDPEILPIEEVNLVVDEETQRNPKDMEKYAPLIFEECYIKSNQKRMLDAFELDKNPQLK